jgi:hypothetical protein
VGGGRRQGATGEHRWGPEVAPGKKIGGGAHPINSASGGGGGGVVGHRGGGRQRWSRHGGL